MSSSRYGYATIREEDNDDIADEKTRPPSSSLSQPIASQSQCADQSDASSSSSKLMLSTQSMESSPLVLVNKKANQELEKRYLERYLRDLEQQKGAIQAKWNGTTSTTTSLGLANWCSKLEVFLANMPLTIGAVGLCWVTLGVVWFKYMEEMNDTCTPVHYHAPMCTFPEFPGCFECDTSNPIYRIALTWHYFCHVVAAICCLFFWLKVLIGGPLVVAELRNPATSTPMGVVCITMVCVFAGRFGWFGEAIVLGTSTVHLILAFWFLYQAVVVYRLYPDPGWFPNTVGLAYAAVKTWLYFPLAGHIVVVLCCIFFVNLYGLTLFRVARNDKIGLPVCFIQLSAPSITLYAITLWAQTLPGQEAILQSNPERLATFNELHRKYYLPVQHFMLAMSLIGLVSVFHALHVRWKPFFAKEFSPAHIALVFPILSHTNAIQAYRSSVDAYSHIPEKSWFKICIYAYWVTCLLCGTILCLVFTYHYVIRLPKWTNLSDDDESNIAEDDAVSIDHSWLGNYFPEGDQGSLPSVLTDQWNSNGIGGGGGGGGASWELLDDIDDAVNPAVLQANETGILVRVRRGTADFERFGPYKRTRRISSVGFDLILTQEELQTERARHRLHRRTVSMSVHEDIGRAPPHHQRSRTMA